MAKKFKKSPWDSAGPIYVAAAVLLGCAIAFVPTTVSGFFVTGLATFCGWAISKMFWPKTLVEIEDNSKKQPEVKPEPEKKEEKKPETDPGIKKRPRTGDPAIDALLDEEERAISEMRRLDKAIEDKNKEVMTV